MCVASLRYCAQERDPALVRAVEAGGLPPDPKVYTWLLTALRACERWHDVSPLQAGIAPPSAREKVAS